MTVKNKIIKFLLRNFCKRRAMGPKTRIFRPTENENFCGRLFSSADLQNRLNSVGVGGSTSLLRHRNY